MNKNKRMTSRTAMIAGILLMAVGVALGAFGAHGFKVMLAATGRTETYDLAIRYLMIHALGIILLGFLMEKFPGMRTAILLLVIGVFFFSGSLLTLALANESWLGAVAPLGGASFIAGWLTAAWTIYRSKG
jgi:uncharacterized membrane protein YgdD (TMEM256/DUF423 family)